MIYSDKEFIGKKLKEYRKNAKLTQEELSSKVNIDEKHYGKLERGVFTPSLETFFKLIEVLSIPLSEFGVKTQGVENKSRDELIKEIYLSNAKEIEAFLNIIKTVKNLI